MAQTKPKTQTKSTAKNVNSKTKSTAKTAAGAAKSTAKPVKTEAKVAEVVTDNPKFSVKVELPAPLVSEMTRQAQLRGLSVEKFIEAIFAVFQQRI